MMVRPRQLPHCPTAYITKDSTANTPSHAQTRIAHHAHKQVSKRGTPRTRRRSVLGWRPFFNAQRLAGVKDARITLVRNANDSHACAIFVRSGGSPANRPCAHTRRTAQTDGWGAHQSTTGRRMNRVRLEVNGVVSRPGKSARVGSVWLCPVCVGGASTHGGFVWAWLVGWHRELPEYMDGHSSTDRRTHPPRHRQSGSRLVRSVQSKDLPTALLVWFMSVQQTDRSPRGGSEWVGGAPAYLP